MSKKIQLDLADFFDVITYIYNRPQSPEGLDYPEPIAEIFGAGRPKKKWG